MSKHLVVRLTNAVAALDDRDEHEPLDALRAHALERATHTSQGMRTELNRKPLALC